MASEPLELRWERELDELASVVAYPATPDLVSGVATEVGGERVPRSAPRPALGMGPRFAVAAALALLVLAATIAIEPARTAVGEFFGLVEGERIELAPSPTAGASATATALPTAAAVESLGSPYTLEELADAVGFELALPGGAEPNAAYLVRYERFRIPVLAYDDYDLWQTKETGFGYFNKLATQENVIDTPRIGESFGYWISGGGHVVRFVDAEGNEVVGSERLIDRNTLIWRSDDGSVFYRLETSLSLEEALAVAEELP